MIVVGLADIHGDTSQIDRLTDVIKEADIVLLVGDITNFGKEDEIKKVFNSMQDHKDKIRAVSGNCDYKEVDRFLSQTNVNLHGKGIVKSNIGFIGLGGSLITPFVTPNELTEDEIAVCLSQGYSQIPSDVDMVLVSHQPPVNTKCDRIASGEHVGSFAVRDFIEKYQPKICFTGHIHESTGVDRIGNTVILNPGMLNKGSYAYAEIGNKDETIEIRKIRY